MSARDGSLLGPCYAEQNLTIRVRVFRNLLAPTFTNNGFYAVRIREDVGVNSGIGVSVSATDADAKVDNQPQGWGGENRVKRVRRRRDEKRMRRGC